MVSCTYWLLWFVSCLLLLCNQAWGRGACQRFMSYLFSSPYFHCLVCSSTFWAYYSILMGVKLFQQHQNTLQLCKQGCFADFIFTHRRQGCKHCNSIRKYDHILHALLLPTFSWILLLILLLIKCLCCVYGEILHTNPFRSQRCVIPAPNMRNKIPYGCPQIFSENYCRTSPFPFQ